MKVPPVFIVQLPATVKAWLSSAINVPLAVMVTSLSMSKIVSLVKAVKISTAVEEALPTLKFPCATTVPEARV